MLTKLRIRNFKKFDEIEVELGQAVMFIGPNNSGKTTALQALALWEIGLQRWNEKRAGKVSPGKRPGVTINRRDLISIPVPSANLLWKGMHVRGRSEARQTQNVCIEVQVDGVSQNRVWTCGLEFDYANEESFYCRPLRTREKLLTETQPPRMEIPREAAGIKVAYLPPMSGLAEQEYLKQSGEIGVLIGQGQTAQVLRNLCFGIHQTFKPDADADAWARLTERIAQLFGVRLDPPQFIAERGEIVMTYRDADGTRLDLSASGRGLQQTLLLLAHLHANPGTVLLLDEPDAHLEILRQRQIYQTLTEVAAQQNSQIIAATHSEVVLNEAVNRDIVIAFVGRPHRIDDRAGSQVLKSLRDIGFDQYYQAEQTGWVLYLEGSTDLAILIEFARLLDHPASEDLKKPFVHPIGTNHPPQARDHFRGLLEAKPDLVGLALFDRLDRALVEGQLLVETAWRRREIENYLCQEETLLAFARGTKLDLFSGVQEETMRESIAEISAALRTLGKDPWSPDIKATDEFLDPLFDLYFRKLGQPNLLRKTNYHRLAPFVPANALDSEVVEKLDLIHAIATRARPQL